MSIVYINRPLSGKPARFRHGGLGLCKRTAMANQLLLVSSASFFVIRQLNLTGQADIMNSPLQTMQPFRHPRVYEIESLKHITLAHGIFYFGPHSHQVEIDSTYEPVLNSMQQELLDDEVIDVQKEKERCERYNYELVDEANPRRRLLFLGSLLGDDSTEVL